MIRPFTKIFIQQAAAKRDSLFELDFVTSYEYESGWENHTDKCVIEFPKNIQLQNEDALFKQSGTYNVILGGEEGFDINGNKVNYPPLIMRGDVVEISHGYLFKNRARENQKKSLALFHGYVTKVESSVPIKIECEDNFYLLKRTPVGISKWTGNLIDLCKYMINRVNTLFANNNEYKGKNGNPYPVLKVTDSVDSITADFSLGYLEIADVTCAELLSQIRQQYKLESFFRGDTLYFGFPIYDESIADSSNIFEFQNNIKKDADLEYRNKGDIVLSAVVSCKTINETGKTTKDGQKATKWGKDSILIYWDMPTGTFKYLAKEKGKPMPPNTGGERREFIYPIEPSKGRPSNDVLFEFGKKQLEKYYYTGFRGSFTTIGYPFVSWGDNVYLVDRIMADRNGLYKVKKVIYRGGMNGIEQEVVIDYKINAPALNIDNVYETYMI